MDIFCSFRKSNAQFDFNYSERHSGAERRADVVFYPHPTVEYDIRHYISVLGHYAKCGDHKTGRRDR